MTRTGLRVRTVAIAALTAPVALLATGPAHAGAGKPDAGALTIAVYGDAPYGTTPTDTAEFQATPAFVDSVNADPDVSLLAHVGDIHSGKQFCTQSYDQSVFDLWTRYEDPVVYTPGDNEWTDCHKKAEGGGAYNASTGQIDYVTANGQPVDYASGNPVANLDLIRSIFFAHPGRTLGQATMPVESQAQVSDPAHPEDAQYVENVLWERRGIVFVTLNIPGGSNNDADPWYGAPTASTAQTEEAQQRTAADVRWLDDAFALAQNDDARSVVVIEQADMWDLDGKTASHLSNYEPLISGLAAHTTAFGGPVLLFDGDSHVYRSDNPLQQAVPCTTESGDGTVACSDDDWSHHPSYDVANFHRITVHGSTFPLEWLKLTIDNSGHLPSGPNTFGPFSWQRMTQPQPASAS